MVWQPPVEPCSAKVKESFAFTSTAERWPTILGGIIDALYQASHALSYSKADQSAKIDEAKNIIEALSKLKHDMGRDKPLEPIGDDGGADTSHFDSTIEEKQWTWYQAPWLFAECYLYRLLRSHFARSTHWKSYDPFSAQKLSAFKSSGAAINQLAQTVEELVKKAEDARSGSADKNSAAESKEGMKLIFHLLCQSSLWGNATDLSLLTSLSHADIQSLQAHGLSAESQASRAEYILTGLGGLDKAWEQLTSSGGSSGNKKVDIVLDNAGFELVTDLLLADWLVATGLVGKVTFHPKAMPWFVSDVTPADFKMTIEALQNPSFFEQRETPAGSRILQMNTREADERRGREASPAPKGSRSLQWTGEEEQAAADEGARGRGNAAGREASEERGRGRAAAAPAGSMGLKLDPSYFQSARSRTVSPSRSYVIDADSLRFSALAMAEKEEKERTPISRLAARWAKHMAEGRFELAFDAPLGAKVGKGGDFWTYPYSFGEMVEREAGRETLQRLRESDLVLFKGDLNYRKLTYDAQWPSTTPFSEAVGPLAGQISLLSLRTCKADVCVGLTEDKEKWVEAKDKEWRINGKWAVVEFLPKTK